ncbi:hypothetical protein MRX96_016392 [Rhipicephalus microplus]
MPDLPVRRVVTLSGRLEQSERENENELYQSSLPLLSASKATTLRAESIVCTPRLKRATWAARWATRARG